MSPQALHLTRRLLLLFVAVLSVLAYSAHAAEPVETTADTIVAASDSALGPAFLEDVAAEADRPLHFLFHSIPLQGHVNPLLAQAEALVQRGHRATIATSSHLESYVRAHKHPAVGFVATGACAEEMAAFPGMIRNATAAEGAAESSLLIFEWIYGTHACMYAPLLAHLRALPQAPARGAVDVLVVDITTVSGLDAAAALSLPVVVNNADLLYVLSPRALPPLDALPMMFRDKSAHDMGAALAERAVAPALRVLVWRMLQSGFGGALAAARAKSGLLAPLDLFSLLSDKLVIQNTAFGLEYARAVPPSVHMVGPCVQASQAGELSRADAAWLARSARPVVFVSMGTLAAMDRHQIAAVLRGLLDAGVRAGALRVVWKLPKAQRALFAEVAAELGVEAAAEDNSNDTSDGDSTSDDDDHTTSGVTASGLTRIPGSVLRVTSWFSSQVRLLSHPHAAVFLSHCGINSAHEAALYGGGRLQLLCLPMFGDQLDMAQRVRDAGIGMFLHKHALQHTHVAAAVTTLLAQRTDPVAVARGRALRRLMRLAGGTRRAADLLEYAGLSFREAAAARAQALALGAGAGSAGAGAGAGAAAGDAVPLVYHEQSGAGVATAAVYDVLGARTPAEARANKQQQQQQEDSASSGCVGFGCGFGDGVSVLVPRDAALSHLQWYGADVAALWAAVLLALVLIAKLCCKCCCCCCGGRRNSAAAPALSSKAKVA